MWISMVPSVLAVRRVDGGVFDGVGVQRMLHSDPAIFDRTLAVEVVDVLGRRPTLGNVLDFERVVPVPDDLEPGLGSCGEIAEWCQVNWGCSSKAMYSKRLLSMSDRLEELLGFGAGECEAFSFATSHGVPDRWCAALSGLLSGYEVVLVFAFDSCDACGVLRFRDGEPFSEFRSNEFRSCREVIAAILNGGDYVSFAAA
jgi:hypothetical protein